MEEIMLMNHFTWLQYFEVLAVLLIVYYAVILVKYYLPEFQQKINGSKSVSSAPLAVFQYEAPVAPEEENSDPLIAETDTLITELKQSLKATPASDPVKNLLKKYPDIKNSPLRPAINELIVTEWEKYSVVLLTEAEVNEWWEA